jgi:hypothetical protein
MISLPEELRFVLSGARIVEQLDAKARVIAG